MPIRFARTLSAAFAVATLLGFAPDAVAGDRLRLGLRAGGFEPSNAQDSYDAVYGDTMIQVGGQFEVHTDRRLFFAATLDYGTADGETVAPTRPPVSTGIGTELTLSPLHLTAAWLLRPRDRAWNLYLGAGPSLLAWSETSDIGDTSASDIGASAVFGLRRELRSWSVGGELRWSTFPNALPDEGLAARFGEDDLGGFGLHLVALYRL